MCSKAFPGKHHCIIPWIFNSSCFNRLEIQGPVIPKWSVCSQHVWNTAHCLCFIPRLFNTTQTLCITPRRAFPHPNNSIINVKYRNAGEKNPTSSQQGPSAFLGWVRQSLFQGNQQWLWEQPQGNSSSSSHLDLNPWQSVSYNNLKLQFCNSFLGTQRSFTKRDNNGEIKRGKRSTQEPLAWSTEMRKNGVIYSIKFLKCRTNLPGTTINELVDLFPSQKSSVFSTASKPAKNFSLVDLGFDFLFNNKTPLMPTVSAEQPHTAWPGGGKMQISKRNWIMMVTI